MRRIAASTLAIAGALACAIAAEADPIVVNESPILFTAERPLGTSLRTTAFGQDLVITGVVADKTREAEHLIAATLQLAIVGADGAILRTTQCVAQPGRDLDCRVLIQPEWGPDAVLVTRAELRLEAIRTVEADERTEQEKERLKREAERIVEAERREQERRNALTAAAAKATEQERERKAREVTVRAARERESAIRARGWPASVTQAAVDKKVIIGMTTEQVVAAWGRPYNINETITARGKSEQWVYGSGQYLYFDNGVLKTIQRSR
jgi:hypothetical protein